MGVDGADYDEPLARASDRARTWLGSLESRRIVPRVGGDQIEARLPPRLPQDGLPAVEVIDVLAHVAEDGLTAMPSGRFFGFVIGGTHPAALAADWLVSAWDQNAALRFATPATAALEAAAGRWLVDLLGLPQGSDVGFVTGATTANFTCLAAARSAVLASVGWDVGDRGLIGAPPVHVLVGQERHETVDLALRYLGLGRPTAVAVDDQGRIDVRALAQSLARVPDGAPLVVALQAGNIHSGAFDPFREAIALVRSWGGWVHVDGAFGLWAAASPRLAHLVDGVDGADSWATDAHKTLNVPYDCGIAVVRDPVALRSAMTLRSSYLIADVTGAGDPHEKVPELSRRARGVPVWAVLTALGRTGVRQLVERLAGHARMLADALAPLDGLQVLNDVVYTQVCLALEDDTLTQAVIDRILDDGQVWMSGSRWRDRSVLRVSVSNWSTGPEDIRKAVAAVRAACDAARF
jgi:glutamate/tyrosine decarboxylase-like PLP-dependent enzyme